jgi:VIT1/CCC1 family predicted Fe2+/Mn2+ transporter
MNHSTKKGFSFGLTSGVITTLGLVVGLHSSTGSTLAVIGGIITIAIADAMSDALGIHISEESEGQHTEKEIWEATIMTFITKFFFASLFIIPFLFFSLGGAIIASIAWGLFLITVMSFSLAKKQGESYLKVISEHLAITILVIIITHYVGDFVKNLA